MSVIFKVPFLNRVQNEQLEAILKLMQNQKEKFGDTSIDEIKDQMKFYCRWKDKPIGCKSYKWIPKFGKFADRDIFMLNLNCFL